MMNRWQILLPNSFNPCRTTNSGFLIAVNLDLVVILFCVVLVRNSNALACMKNKAVTFFLLCISHNHNAHFLVLIRHICAILWFFLLDFFFSSSFHCYVFVEIKYFPFPLLIFICHC